MHMNAAFSRLLARAVTKPPLASSAALLSAAARTDVINAMNSGSCTAGYRSPAMRTLESLSR
jgi:hypothetical protein